MTRAAALAVAALACMAAWAPGCSGPDAAPATPCPGIERQGLGVPANHSVVALDTSLGCMVAELFDDVTPLTVRNFLAYVDDGFYTDLQWHRVIRDYVAQVGGVGWDGAPREPTRPPIPDEAPLHRLHNGDGTLAMARLADPAFDSATTQFFVNLGDNWNLDPGSSSDEGYCVFGRLVAGAGVAHAIGDIPAGQPAPLLHGIRRLA